MFLKASDKIRVKLGGAVATNNVVFTSCWVDENTVTKAFIGDNNAGTISGTTNVDVITTPSTDHQFQVSYISIYNADTADVTVTIQHYDGSTDYIKYKVTLRPLETWQYSHSGGPSAISNGAEAAGEAAVIAPDQTIRYFMSPPGNIAAVQSAASSGTTPTGHAPYWGVAAYGYSQVVVEYEVSLAGGTVTWAEIGLFIGRPLLLSATGWIHYFKPVAYADVTAAAGSLGLKSATMTIGAGKIRPGDHLWLGFAASVSAGNNVQIRGQAAESFDAGFCMGYAFQPSLRLDALQRCTVDTGVPPWLCVQFS